MCRGGEWLVSMQHFCLHDCVAFAIWYVLAIGGVLVALCAICDAPTSPVDNCCDAHFCGFGITMVVAKQTFTMHALHIGLCLIYEKVGNRGATGVSVPCAQVGVAATRPPGY